MALPDTPQGTTISFLAASFTALLLAVNGEEISVPVIDKTKLSDTTSRRKMGGKLVDEGSLRCRCQFDPDDRPPILQGNDTVTVTFPVPSGGSSGATIAGEAFVSAWTFDATQSDSGLMEAEFTLTWTGDTGPSWVASV